MNYIVAHRSLGSKRARVITIAFGIAVSIVTLLFIFAPHFWPALWTSVARPFWRAEFSISSGSLESREQLLNENEDLKRQLADLYLKVSSAGAVEDENRELKALMGRASTTPYILAVVLQRPPLSPYDELIIDVGLDHGLSTSNKVYAPGNVPIGRVFDVLSQTAKVMLYSSPGEKYDVLIGRAHLPAVATGRGGGQYEAELPRDAAVSQGDFVISPSLNDKVFGVVGAIVKDPSNPFETVLFAPPVNIYQLRWVLVEAKVKIPNSNL